MSALCLALAAPAHASAPPVLAVLDIRDHTARFEPAQLAQWSLYLSAQLAEGGRYLLLPPGEAQAKLDLLLADSFRASHDEGAQIEAGRRLSAELLVEPRLIEAEGGCALIAALYDVERGTTEQVAQRKAPCNAEGLTRAARGVGRALAGEEELDAEVELPEPAEPERPLSTDWLTVGLGYGSTLGGAGGMMLTAQLFTLRGRWLSWSIVDLGLSLGARRDSKDALFGADHSMMYAGSTLGAALALGSDGAHRVGLTAGPALYSSQPDDFFGEVQDADATGGPVPAALLGFGYTTDLTAPEGLGRMSIGAALRAVLPVSVDRGAPQLLLATLTLGVGP